MSTDQKALRELIDTANATAAEQEGKETDEEELDTKEGGDGEEEETGREEGAGKRAVAADDKDKARKDPTEGMTDAQKIEYWQKRANRHYGEWQKLKAKTKSQLGGGLSDAGKGAGATGSDKVVTDGAPKSLDEVENLGQFSQYLLAEAKRQINEEWTEKDLDSRVSRTERTARAAHNGEDGFPEYDEVVDTYVLPLIQKNPNVFKLLRLMDNPGEAAYTLGMLQGFPEYANQLKGQGREELAKTINDATHKAALVRGRNGGKQPSGKLTKADIEAMSADDFEREIAKVKGE